LRLRNLIFAPKVSRARAGRGASRTGREDICECACHATSRTGPQFRQKSKLSEFEIHRMIGLRLDAARRPHQRTIQIYRKYLWTLTDRQGLSIWRSKGRQIIWFNLSASCGGSTWMTKRSRYRRN
jgi:hypothetical protein